RFPWTATLGVMLGLPGICIAEDVVWRAVTPDSPPPPAIVAPGPIATLGRPIAASAGPSENVEPIVFRPVADGAPGAVIRPPPARWRPGAGRHPVPRAQPGSAGGQAARAGDVGQVPRLVQLWRQEQLRAPRLVPE